MIENGRKKDLRLDFKALIKFSLESSRFSSPSPCLCSRVCCRMKVPGAIHTSKQSLRVVSSFPPTPYPHPCLFHHCKHKQPEKGTMRISPWVEAWFSSTHTFSGCYYANKVGEGSFCLLLTWQQLSNLLFEQQREEALPPL